MTFKPHITVACVVQAEGYFLMVEELVNGQITLNQPAGHLEAGESLINGAQRELWEETGLTATLQSLLKVYQWLAPDGTPFIRFTFCLDLPKRITTQPNDSDIVRCIWLPEADIINATNLRSPLVLESLYCYKQGEYYPLSLLQKFV